MKKSRTKYVILGVIAAVLVFGVVAYGVNPEVFQGWAGRFVQKTPKIDYFVFRNNPVSIAVTPVTSPVISPVISTVVSAGGPSQVASPVVSPVTSPVASSVPLQKRNAQKINIKNLPQLTSKVLIEAAKEDLKKNPKKYQLNKTDKLKLIQMFEKIKSVQNEKIQFIKDFDAGLIEIDEIMMDNSIESVKTVK